MAIVLPPPITPQQAPLAEVWVHGEKALQLQYKGARIFLAGRLVDAKVVDPALIQKMVTQSETISIAIRVVGALYYQAGYPATLITYAIANSHDVFLRAEPGRVTEVRGADPVRGYFDNLKSHPFLTGGEFESDRVLADALSERGGLNYRPEFKPLGDGDAVALDLGIPADTGKQIAAGGGFSNYGNRYAGPYLADAAVRGSLASGDELSLSGVVGVRALGLGGSHSEPYKQGDVAYSRITPWGVFGLQGRYANFQQKVEADGALPPPVQRLDGLIGLGGASWLIPLYADFQRRLNLQAKFDRDYETVTAHDADKVLSELYNSIEADLSYLQRVPLGDDELQAQVGIALRKGLSEKHSTGTPANLAYFLWRPSFNLTYALGVHWTLVGEGDFQLGGSRVPQLEQFVLGGPGAEHAFESGAGVGDRGQNLRLSAGWKDIGDTWLSSHMVHPRLFAEYGRSTLSGAEPAEPSGKVNIADVGADIDAHLTHWLQATLSVAKSIHEHGEDSSPDGLAEKYVFFRLTAQY